jgi:hypothetical protein
MPAQRSPPQATPFMAAVLVFAAIGLYNSFRNRKDKLCHASKQPSWRLSGHVLGALYAVTTRPVFQTSHLPFQKRIDLALCGLGCS